MNLRTPSLHISHAEVILERDFTAHLRHPEVQISVHSISVRNTSASFLPKDH